MHSKQISENTAKWENPYKEIQYKLRKSLEQVLTTKTKERPYPHLVASRNKYLARKESFGEVYTLSVIIRPLYHNVNENNNHSLNKGRREIVLFIHTDLNPNNLQIDANLHIRLVLGDEVWNNENMLIAIYRISCYEEEIKKLLVQDKLKTLNELIASIVNKVISEHDGNKIPRH